VGVTVLLLSALLTCALLMWEGMYAEKGNVSRLAKDGSLAALHEWREERIE